MQRDAITTHIRPGFWPRGGRVTIGDDGQVNCPLELARQYDLVAECRRYSAHRRFLLCNTDQQWIDFVRAWGPLYIPGLYVPADFDWFRRWKKGYEVDTVSLPLTHYCAYQRRLKALANLLLSCGKGRLDGQTCVRDFIAADKAWRDVYGPTKTTISDRAANIAARHGVNLDLWLTDKPVPASDARQVAAIFLELACSETTFLSVQHDGNQFHIEPRWDIAYLAQALQWLVWTDKLASCQECGELFQVTSYRWKYCTDECAHKATDRKWRSEWRKSRRNRRKEKRARKLRASK
jgi:hypothetical protein